MKSLLSICLGMVAMACSAQSRLTERPMADIAFISVPSNLETEDRLKELVAPRTLLQGENTTYRDDLIERLTFGFSSTYLWASMGSVTTYRQLLIASVMAPDAPAAEYAKVPRRFGLSYDQRRQLGGRTVGTGTLTISEGLYTRGSVTEPAFQFLYADRSRRLQLVWHAVKKEVDLEAGVAQIARMAQSFRIVRDPLDWFAAVRDLPRQEAEQRAQRLATVHAMLKREGYGTLEPGKPVFRNGAYIEWMSTPEPRFQLLVPLGRARAAENGSVVNRPRPVLGSGIGWREFTDGEWAFSNQEQAYLPMRGVGAVLAAKQQDPAFVYFYYAATVRVEEESDDSFLKSLSWFFDGVPEVHRRWREGALLSAGKPVKE